MWWKNSVVYQIYPRSFNDSNKDGIGDIRGIINKLDYLKRLGVDVLWLCPVYPTPNKDNGYDISDYYDINPEYGTMEDMIDLITKAKAMGIYIMMDIVANHTSSEHSWFKEACKSKDSIYHKYYVFRDNLGHLPSDQQSIFLNSAWELNEETNEYYLHMFDKDQPDLDWHHLPVREEIYNILRFWIDLGVKGFRFDVIDLIAKDIDNHITGDGPLLHTYIREMADQVLRDADLITVGETWSADTEKAKLYSNPDQSEFSMIFNFRHFLLDNIPGKEKWDTKDLHLIDLKEHFNDTQINLRNQGWNSLFWNNHDLPRIVSRWGNDSREFRERSAMMLATLLHMMQGTPYIYQGEELGMTNHKFESIDDYRDVEIFNMIEDRLNRGFSMESIQESIDKIGRDNARTPMQWNSKEHAGFTEGNPWIKVNRNYKEINAEEQIHRETSVFNHYRKLIQLRRHSAYAELIKNGTFELVMKDHPSIFAYKRTYQDQTILVLCNFYQDEVLLDQSIRYKELILSNYTNLDKLVTKLRPYEAVILTTENTLY